MKYKKGGLISSLLELSALPLLLIGIGAAQCQEGDTADSLIKRADDNLYCGKQNQKNKVV